MAKNKGHSEEIRLPIVEPGDHTRSGSRRSFFRTMTAANNAESAALKQLLAKLDAAIIRFHLSPLRIILIAGALPTR